MTDRPQREGRRGAVRRTDRGSEGRERGNMTTKDPEGIGLLKRRGGEGEEFSLRIIGLQRGGLFISSSGVVSRPRFQITSSWLSFRERLKTRRCYNYTHPPLRLPSFRPLPSLPPCISQHRDALVFLDMPPQAVQLREKLSLGNPHVLGADQLGDS